MWGSALTPQPPTPLLRLFDREKVSFSRRQEIDESQLKDNSVITEVRHKSLSASPGIININQLPHFTWRIAVRSVIKHTLEYSY